MTFFGILDLKNRIIKWTQQGLNRQTDRQIDRLLIITVTSLRDNLTFRTLEPNRTNITEEN